MEQIKQNCYEVSWVGGFRAHSLSILQILPNNLRWPLKPFHGLQFETHPRWSTGENLMVTGSFALLAVEDQQHPALADK